MVKYDFKNCKVDLQLTLVSEDGEIEDFESIKHDVETDLNDVLAEIMNTYNSFVGFELSDVNISAIGDDNTK